MERRLAAALRGARVKAEGRGYSVSGFEPAEAADAVPLIENVAGVRAVEMTEAELCPLACAAGARALPVKPLDFRKGLVLIAGPCAVEDEVGYLACARALKACGAHALRAALFKPRSSPYAYQGLGYAGLAIIAKAKRLTGLPLVTEATDTRQVCRLASVCDVLQIGARNMRNYELLKEAGRAGMPVLLKRAMRATLKEWLLSAEYLLRYGAKTLILCERGDSMKPGEAPGLDLALMRRAQKLTGLPVVADPSHATRERKTAASSALQAARAGADGLLIEASLAPEAARVDGRQTLPIGAFSRLAQVLRRQRR